MTSESESLKCSTHGESSAAYVCTHLAAEPVQRWYCDYPTEDNRCPDAWCEKCNNEYLKQGEWNEANEGAVEIKLICAQCYDTRKGQSVDYIDKDTLERWNEFVSMCCNDLSEKQNSLTDEFQINEHKRWDWDQETAKLIFSNDGVPAVFADIAFAGTVSTISNTWLWGWANFHLLENVRTPLIAVREYGEQHGYPRLTVPKWPADQADGWHMAAIAAYVMNARGVYRTPSDTGYTFLILREVRRVS